MSGEVSYCEYFTFFDKIGFLGRLQIRRSGAVTLNIENVSFDVSPGAPCSFYQQVMERGWWATLHTLV